jgi:hypothetical protein
MWCWWRESSEKRRGEELNNQTTLPLPDISTPPALGSGSLHEQPSYQLLSNTNKSSRNEILYHLRHPAFGGSAAAACSREGSVKLTFYGFPDNDLPSAYTAAAATTKAVELPPALTTTP